jgi:hypothetical protein
MAEHRKNARKSTREKHQNAQAKINKARRRKLEDPKKRRSLRPQDREPKEE